MTTQGMAQAIQAVQAWDQAGRPRHTSMAGKALAQAATQALTALLDACHTDGYWRGTNRAAEYAAVQAGVAIVSTDHTTGRREAGMSVSRSLATVWAYGYRYAYQVTGTLVGAGADGEPVLTDVQTTSPLYAAADALAQDTVPARCRAALQAVEQATGIPATLLDWLAHN